MKPSNFWRQAAVTAVYTIVAVLNLELGRPSPIWIPSGLAVLVLLLGGRRYVWALVAGIFLSAALSGTFATWVGIARTSLVIIGTMVEAMIVVEAINRWAGGRPFVKLNNCLIFYLAALAASLVNALVGASSSALLLGLGWAAWWARFYTWLLGDLIGIVVVVPLVLSLWRRGRRLWWLSPIMAAGISATTLLVLRLGGLPFVWLSFFVIAVAVFLDDVRGAAVAVATQFLLIEQVLTGTPADVLYIQVYILGVSLLAMSGASSTMELREQNETLASALAAFEARLRELQGEKHGRK